MLDLNYISDQKKLGKRIRSAREDNHLTQAQLAEKIGAKRETISAWEHGRQLPDLKKISALCQALEIDMGYLFGEYDSPNSNIICASEYTGLSEKAVRTLHNWSRTDEHPDLFSADKAVSVLDAMLSCRIDFLELTHYMCQYLAASKAFKGLQAHEFKKGTYTLEKMDISAYRASQMFSQLLQNLRKKF
jgi:transcriptional regulator with XRE-family HTH domain